MEKRTILIVDDEEIILELTVNALKADNFNLLTAKSGEEGLDKLGANEVHLVISDQNMTGMTGLEFLQMVKVKYPSVITIMLTGYADLETAVNAINNAGVYKFIIKPWNVFDLRATIWRALEMQLVLSEKSVLLDKIKKYEDIFTNLSQTHPDIIKIEKDENGNMDVCL